MRSTLNLALMCMWGMAACAAEPARMEPVRSKVPFAAEEFDLRDVQLLDSRFKLAQTINRKLLVEADFDRLMHPFRCAAGLPTPIKGVPDGSNYALTGHIAGHFLSACALHFRNTGDTDIKNKADAVVAEIARCQDAIGTGYIGGFPENKFEFVGVPWYCLHKIYAGLLDMHLLADNQQAAGILKRLTDWADQYTARLSDGEMQGRLRTEHGGICEFWANLHAATGDERCLRLAERFVHHAAVDPFAKGEDHLDNCHANTQIPKFSSVARLHQLTGKPEYWASAFNFWKAVSGNRSYVTGGNSYAEYFRPMFSYYIGTRNTESCNQYNMLKLTRYLFNQDPSAAFADFYERTLYNHVLSTRNLQTGGQLYFQPLQSGNIKGDPSIAPSILGWRFLFHHGRPDARLLGSEMSCCSGSGLESNAKYADSIYFHHGNQALFLNQFIPSILDWKGNGIRLHQETRYPEEAATRLRIESGEPRTFTLHVRRPWWATRSYEILINGETIADEASPGTYAHINRSWKNGDIVDIRMPMSLRMEGFNCEGPQNKDEKAGRVAIMYGPLVMAAEVEYGNPFSAIVAKDTSFLEMMKPAEGKPLEFIAPPDVFRTAPLTVRQKPVLFRPLHLTFDTPYAVYWDLFDPATFTQETAWLAAELQRHKDMEPRTVDMVLCSPKGEAFSLQSQLLVQPGWLQRPAQAVSEAAHGMTRNLVRKRNISWLVSEMPLGYKGEFVLLEPDTSRAYTMKTLPDQPQLLEVLIWKSQFNRNNVLLKQGTLELAVDGQAIGVCDAAAMPAGQFTTVSFPIPPELVKGKNSAEITLRVPAKSEAVSGIYECRIVTP